MHRNSCEHVRTKCNVVVPSECRRAFTYNNSHNYFCRHRCRHKWKKKSINFNCLRVIFYRFSRRAFRRTDITWTQDGFYQIFSPESSNLFPRFSHAQHARTPNFLFAFDCVDIRQSFNWNDLRVLAFFVFVDQSTETVLSFLRTGVAYRKSNVKNKGGEKYR